MRENIVSYPILKVDYVFYRHSKSLTSTVFITLYDAREALLGLF